MRPWERPATKEEVTADLAKRKAALDWAETAGIYSTAELGQHRAALENFKGYTRDTREDPK